MNLLRSLLVLLLLAASLPIRAQHFDWAQSIGGLGLDVGRDLTTDSQGNVILVGSFTGSTQLADTFLVGNGQREAFVAKFSADGELRWARLISGPREDLARGVVTDDQDNIYVVGHFTNEVEFVKNDTDTVVATGYGKKDAFVAKYSPDGSFQWYLRGGGTGDDTATDIDWHPYTGKLYVSGGFEGRGAFGTVTMLSSGLMDAYLFKLDPDGNVHWATKGGGAEHDVAAAVAVDVHTGNIYMIGDLYDEAVFSGELLEGMGSSDMYLIKYNEEGEMLWARHHGGTSVDVATDVGTDLNGNVFVTGYFQGTTFFQQHTAISEGYNDVFLAKFDADGNCTWLRSAGGDGLDNCMGLSVDWNGTTYLSGLFYERIVASGDTTYGNGYDAFILSYTPDGEVVYGRSAGAGSSDFGMRNCLSNDGSLYLTGYYYFFADFDDHTIGIAENGDAFLARMTDIVGIRSSLQPDWDNCLSQTGPNTLRSHCLKDGTWSLFDLAGRMVQRGPIPQDGVVELRSGSTGIHLFTVSDGAEQTSLRLYLR